jgi:nucleoside-diphosphate-sugar epimerase
MKNKPRILPAPLQRALPARFRRPRLLIVGCGDVGLRVARSLPRRLQPLALTSSPQRLSTLRAAGLRPLVGNLDAPATLRRLAGLSTHLLHLVPPPALGSTDPRTAALLRALRRRSLPSALVYGSTSGVYGDYGGQLVSETRAVNPMTARAARRIHAETLVRGLAGRPQVLRIPGIYAPDREGGTPLARLQRGQPVLHAADDVFTNHIHADDLARACVCALWRGGPRRVYNVCDDTTLRMGDYYDQAADLYGLPRPPRVARAQAQALLPAMTYSFMQESRRLDNTRLKRELRFKLRYPAVLEGLRAGLRQMPER